MHSPLIKVFLVAHEAKQNAHVGIYPRVTEAVAAAAHESHVGLYPRVTEAVAATSLVTVGG